MASQRHNNTKMLFYIWINKAWGTVYIEKGSLEGVMVRAGVGLFLVKLYVLFVTK